MHFVSLNDRDDPSGPPRTRKCRREDSPFKMPAKRRRKSNVHNWRWPLRAMLSHGETHQDNAQKSIVDARRHGESRRGTHTRGTVPDARDVGASHSGNYEFSKWSARRPSANRTSRFAPKNEPSPSVSYAQTVTWLLPKRNCSFTISQYHFTIEELYDIAHCSSPVTMPSTSVSKADRRTQSRARAKFSMSLHVRV